MDTFPPSGAGFPSVESAILTFPGGAAPIADPYWPVAGVTKPQHFWPFYLTGDYSDHGSVGGLTLLTVPHVPDPTGGSYPGTGNYFSNGLVFDGGGPVYSPYNADISNLGSVFSIVVKVKMNRDFVPISILGVDWTNGFGIIWQPGTPQLNYQLYKDFPTNFLQLNGITTLSNGVEYIIIFTFNNGVYKAYINGVEDTIIEAPESTGSINSLPDVGQGIYIGDHFDYPDDPAGNGTVIPLAGVLKGTAWSQADVTAIQVGLG